MSSGQLCNSRVQLFRAGNPSYPAAASPNSPSCNRIHFSESDNRLFVHLWPVLPMDEGIVSFVMLEVLLLNHGRSVDVIIRGDAVFVRNLCQLLHILNIIIATNVDVEEDRVSVLVLLAN